MTVDELLDAYLAGEDFADKAAVTKAVDRGRIERHLRPLLGKKHAHLVTEHECGVPSQLSAMARLPLTLRRARAAAPASRAARRR